MRRNPDPPHQRVGTKPREATGESAARQANAPHGVSRAATAHSIARALVGPLESSLSARRRVGARAPEPERAEAPSPRDLLGPSPLAIHFRYSLSPARWSPPTQSLPSACAPGWHQSLIATMRGVPNAAVGRPSPRTHPRKADTLSLPRLLRQHLSLAQSRCPATGSYRQEIPPWREPAFWRNRPVNTPDFAPACPTPHGLARPHTLASPVFRGFSHSGPLAPAVCIALPPVCPKRRARAQARTRI
jgi:hypothetical protein